MFFSHAPTWIRGLGVYISIRFIHPLHALSYPCTLRTAFSLSRDCSGGALEKLTLRRFFGRHFETEHACWPTGPLRRVTKLRLHHSDHSTRGPQQDSSLGCTH